jgi:predicted Zn finger-like uncharacterized protein
MIVTCQSCKTKLKIAEEKLPKNKNTVLIRCPKCKENVILNLAEKQEQQATQNDFDKTEITELEDKTEINISNTATKQFKKAKLIRLDNKQEFALKVGKNIIGRSQNADITLADPKMSRKHCYIEMQIKNESFAYVLVDDGSISDKGVPSTNGTFYNGKKLSPYDKPYLDNQDKIRVGSTELVFVL